MAVSGTGRARRDPTGCTHARRRREPAGPRWPVAGAWGCHELRHAPAHRETHSSCARTSNRCRGSVLQYAAPIVRLAISRRHPRRDPHCAPIFADGNAVEAVIFLRPRPEFAALSFDGHLRHGPAARAELAPVATLALPRALLRRTARAVRPASPIGGGSPLVGSAQWAADLPRPQRGAGVVAAARLPGTASGLPSKPPAEAIRNRSNSCLSRTRTFPRGGAAVAPRTGQPRRLGRFRSRTDTDELHE